MAFATILPDLPLLVFHIAYFLAALPPFHYVTAALFSNSLQPASLAFIFDKHLFISLLFAFLALLLNFPLWSDSTELVPWQKFGTKKKYQTKYLSKAEIQIIASPA